MEDCTFCKIVEGEMDTDLIYEDEKVIAFKDINPQAPVHILIIPRKHISTLQDVEDYTIIEHIYKIANQLANEYNIADDGYRVVVNCNDDGGQVVYHLHFHLLGGRKLKGLG